MSYTREPPPSDNLPDYLNRELLRVQDAVSILRNFKQSKDYTLTANSSQTVADADVFTNCMAMIVLDGASSPPATIIKLNRSGTSNGCYSVFSNSEWGVGTTAEPGDGTSARAWIESTSVGARLVVKNLTASNRKMKIYSLRV